MQYSRPILLEGIEMRPFQIDCGKGKKEPKASIQKDPSGVYRASRLFTNVKICLGHFHFRLSWGWRRDIRALAKQWVFASSVNEAV
jgi:hypothetical protein